MRRQLRGVTASRGLALGRARVLHPQARVVEETRVAADQVDAELARLHGALDATRGELRALRERLHGAGDHDGRKLVDPPLEQGEEHTFLAPEVVVQRSRRAARSGTY